MNQHGMFFPTLDALQGRETHMSTIHVALDGRNETLNISDVFTPERGFAADITASNLTESQVKDTLASYFDVNPAQLRDHTVVFNPNGTLTVRPNASWG